VEDFSSSSKDIKGTSTQIMVQKMESIQDVDLIINSGTCLKDFVTYSCPITKINLYYTFVCQHEGKYVYYLYNMLYIFQCKACSMKVQSHINPFAEHILIE
jgi:hypothetical protein